MPRPRRGPRDPAPAGPPPTGRSALLTEVAEAFGAEFEEAGAHLLLRADYADLRSGPVVPLALGDLEPGCLGWRQPLGLRRTPEAPGTDLFLVLLPSAHPPHATDLPVRGQVRGPEACLVALPGAPRGLLWARTAPGIGRDRLQGLLEQLRDLLVREES